MSRGRRIGSVLFVLSLSGAFGPAVRCESGINTLRGIERIRILIEDLNADAVTDGISESVFQSQAESALKQVGLKVTDSNSNLADLPVLYISLSADKADGFQTFAIRVELLQAVTLGRDQTIQASSATTWSTFRFGRVAERGYSSKIRSTLTILLQNFQDDFLSVNHVVWPQRDRVQTTSAAGDVR